MRTQKALCVSFGLSVLLTLGLFAQPEPDKDRGFKKGPPDGKKGFELGKVLPPHIREELELTEDQEKELADLEKEVRTKLLKILTKDQQKRVREMGKKDPKGPPDGEEKGPPDRKEKKPKGPPDGKEKDGLPPRPPMDARMDDPETTNLVKNPVFARESTKAGSPENYTLQGDAEWLYTGGRFEFAHRGIAFHSAKDLDGDGMKAGSVYQDVSGLPPSRGKWFRFSFRGLAESNFIVSKDDLAMKVEFFSKNGPLDGVTRILYPQVEKDRRELAENGKFRKGGGAVWRTYALDFMIPFAEIDRVRLLVTFGHGAATTEKESHFFLSEFSLTPISDPMKRPQVARGLGGKSLAPADLIPLGGRWYYLPEKADDKTKPAKLVVDHRNADRLFYLDDRLTNPFAENMSAWLLKGYLDIDGNPVTADRFVPDNVVIRFEDDKTMIVHAKNLPNHPTATFPALPGSGDRNPSYIQEHAYTYFIPLNPTRNPNAVAMDKTNSNRALPMGAIGIAINGVVFYNPFDAGNWDATDFMDRCCGHPSPDNRYHYHKYPVCAKTPFVDEGEDHSPLIGFAFDGLPIYGPYESKGVMAKDAESNRLNDFNLHHDEARGWHYHVTPGRYPYVLGGYWGTLDNRNMRGKKGGPKKI